MAERKKHDDSNAMEAGSLSHDFNTTAFFQYVQETQEPTLLVYNRVPKTGSTALQNIFADGASSCPAQLKSLELNETYWFGYDSHEEDADDVIRRHLSNSKAAHGVVSGHFSFPREPETMRARWDTPRVEFINTVRKCGTRMRSNLLYAVFASHDAHERIKTGTQAAYVEDMFGKGVDPGQCLQDDACIEKMLQSDRFSEFLYFSRSNAIENYLGGVHWKDQGFGSAKEAVRERVFAPKMGPGGYIAVGLLEAEEDSMLLFQCLLPSFFRQRLGVLGNVRSNENDPLTIEGVEHPYEKLEARFEIEQYCLDEDSLYRKIESIHRLLASKVKADPSLCRKRPQSFEICDHKRRS